MTFSPRPANHRWPGFSYLAHVLLSKNIQVRECQRKKVGNSTTNIKPLLRKEREKYAMIILVEFDTAVMRVIAIPTDQSAYTTSITCNLDYDPLQKAWTLPKKHIAMIDVILDAKTVMVFKSAADRDRFIELTKRYTKFRIFKNSVLLPLSVISRIEESSPVTPAILIAALAADGIKTAADLRHRKAAL